MLKLLRIKEIRRDLAISVLLFIFIVVSVVTMKIDILFVKERSPTLCSISVTLVGFLITALTILITFPENSKIKFLKKHPLYPYIFYSFILSIGLFLGVFIICLFLMFLDDYILSLTTILTLALVFMFIWAVISLFRCVWILKRMIDLYFAKKQREIEELDVQK